MVIYTDEDFFGVQTLLLRDELNSLPNPTLVVASQRS